MKQRWFLTTVLCGLPACLLAQPQIGGGTCSSATLSGNYAVSITGRQLGASMPGVFGAYLEGNGTANFDGQSKVTLSLTVNTNQTAGTALNWSGTYTVQANCLGQISVATGGSAKLNVAIDSVNPANMTANFALSGSDATYTYSGSGNPQPAGCSTATLAGVYAYNASGVFLNSGVVNSPFTSVGLMQFDGQGSLTVSGWGYGSGSNSNPMLTWSGTYSLTDCIGAATLMDTNGHTVNANFSVTSENAIYSSNLFVSFSRGAHYVISGAAHAIYGQPTAAGGAPTAPAPAAGVISGGSCSASMLNGTYSLSENGRQISSTGTLTSTLDEAGQVTFDGAGAFTYSAVAAVPGASGPISGVGTYTVNSNCTGTALTAGKNASTSAVVVWNGGRNFNIAGFDANYVYSGSGGSAQPPACGTATLSGAYPLQETGVIAIGAAIQEGADSAGILQFDGQGNATGSITGSLAGMPPQTVSLSGTYAVAANCTATATLMASGSPTTSLSMVITGPHGENLIVLGINSFVVAFGSAHSAFTNPSEAIKNVASYAYSATPPGSALVLFGENLATKESNPNVLPLLTSVLGTSVMVNNELAPLYYVSPGQIDAQMPWDIPGGTLATVVVKNASGSSNVAAVWVPATATPGLSVYSNNRAVVVNQDSSINAPDAPAHVGDEVVQYFTGGGPVNAAGRLVSGAASPAGLSPVTDMKASVTVGGMAATVAYVGLTAGSVGLYQANFFIPQLSKGTYPVVLTIDGVASSSLLDTYYPDPVINVVP